MTSPIQAAGDGAVIQIKVVPRASKNEISGLHGDALKVRLKAPPVDGKANKELLRFMAKALQLSTQQLQITSGASSRNKRVKVDSLTPEEVTRRLKLVPRPGSKGM